MVHNVPCLTPVCGLIPGIVLEVEMSELSKPKENLQDPGEAQGREEAQFLGAESRGACTPLGLLPSCFSPQFPHLPLRRPCPRKL